MQYAQYVGHALDRALDSAEELPFDVVTDRYVILSDQHRSQRDAVDEFRNCERAYNAALEADVLAAADLQRDVLSYT